MDSEREVANFLAAGGEAGAILAALDWHEHVLGPVESWPQSLQTAVSICLASRYPICILWGPERIYFYNDAYTPIVGAKHPQALGDSYPRVWPEIWEGDIRPILEQVETTGQASWSDNLLLVLRRYGFPEECYFEFSFAPIRDETGRVGGVFTAITETTQQLVGERRLRTLRDIGTRTTDARTAAAACVLAGGALAANRHDIPFLLLYLLERDGTRARLVESRGVESEHPCAPSSVTIAGGRSNGESVEVWPFAEVARTGRPVVVNDLGQRFGFLSGGPWPEPCEMAVVLPLVKGGQERSNGFLIVGVSPRRPFDDGYQGFFELVARSLAGVVANARAYEEEWQRAETLAEMDRAKTLFFSNVSHEFRTPLTLMLGPLDELLSRPDSEPLCEHREMLNIVYRNCQRLLKLVNTLLEFSRIEAGRVLAVYEPVDLAADTVNLASVFRSAVEQAGMRLTVDCPPLPERVYVDRGMWEKIVLNLLSNAFKFTLEGEIAVTLRAVDGAAVLSVRDTGTGIPESELPNLFKRFHRVEGAQGRTTEGTGIGLALVLELTALHAGTVAVDSVLGEGSTFTVRLPFGKAHLPEERIGGRGASGKTALGAEPFVQEALRWLPDSLGRLSSPSQLQQAANGEPRPKIVLVDDNADMRLYLERLLTDDYDVVAVADGESALRAVDEHRPDLVLTDVMMPGLDGFALLQALRQDPSTAFTPLLVLSARAGEEARVEGLAAGADDYLVKPFSANELLARVAALLKLAQIRREAAAAQHASEKHLLHAADQRKDHFLATLAHELRSPLSALHNGLECLRDAVDDDEEVAGIHAVMERQLKSMERLIADLLDVSRIRRDVVDLQRERLELAGVVRDAVETSRPLIERRGHELHLSLPAEPTFVDGDAVRLAQVFSNLLTNAAKYTDPGGRIELTLERRDGTAVVTVKDSGLGISPEMLSKVFEMFAQVDPSQKATHGGLGIGLSLVKRFVDLHGGEVEARSDGPGQGSEFIVRLPLAS